MLASGLDFIGRRGNVLNLGVIREGQMPGFSIGEAWSQGVAFVSAHFKTMLIYLLIGVLAPVVLQFLVLGGSLQSMISAEALAQNPNNPAAVFALIGVGGFAVMLIGMIVQSASYFASWRHGLLDGAEDAGRTWTFALVAAILSLIAMFAIIIVFSIAAGIIIGLPLGLVGAMVGSGGSPGVGVVSIGFIAVLAVLVAAMWLFARLSVMGPVMAQAGNTNPIFGLATSWHLTRQSQWAIMGYLALLTVVAFVVFFVIGTIVGAGMVSAMSTGSAPGTGSLVTLTVMSLLLGVPVAFFYVAVPAGIYRALAPDDASGVFG
jgi:hypothetical protein